MRISTPGCRISSFTTIDLAVVRRIGAGTELFGSVRNVFDRVAPFDPLTHGAIGYNPLDHAGAVGRFYGDLGVQPAGASQRGVEHFGAVGAAHPHHVPVALGVVFATEHTIDTGYKLVAA